MMLSKFFLYEYAVNHSSRSLTLKDWHEKNFAVTMKNSDKMPKLNLIMSEYIYIYIKKRHRLTTMFLWIKYSVDMLIICSHIFIVGGVWSLDSPREGLIECF